METTISELSPIDTTGLCLLSLDGGGVRGLSSLYILRMLMNELNSKREAAGLAPVKPYEIFDIIGGTSTGGIIAILLGRLRMSVDECIEEYNNVIGHIFEKPRRILPFNTKGNTEPRYSPRKLEGAINNVLEKYGFSRDERFLEDSAKCKTFVCVVAESLSRVTCIRNYKTPLVDEVPATITQAALATSAANTFFPPVTIGGEKFVDGALGANNPIDLVEQEARRFWCRERGDLKPLVKCFISIGTGVPGIQSVEKNILKLLVKTMTKIVTDTEDTHQKFEARWNEHLRDDRFFRFNVSNGLQEVGLQEFGEKAKIHQVTRDYLNKESERQKLEKCASNLVLKQKSPDELFHSVVEEHFRALILASSDVVKAVCWSVPFQRNSNFAGRQQELLSLEKKMLSSMQPQRSSIFGLGGVGKTQLAIELAYRVKEQISVFWMTAISPESLRKSYIDAARELKIADLEESSTSIETLVHARLVEKRTGPWLMVVDNADEIATLLPGSMTLPLYLNQHLPRTDQGAILFTTRSKAIALRLANSYGTVVEVPAMDQTASFELVENMLFDKKLLQHAEDLQTLLELLCYLPLAITQAISYINENSCDIGAYISFFRGQERDVISLLGEYFPDEGRYLDQSDPVATTWFISFEMIRQTEPLAADWLAFMSCLDHRGIPTSILPPGKDELQEIRAIGILKAYSFITEQNSRAMYDMHRLVHLVTRNWLRKEGRLNEWTHKVYSRLNAVLPDMLEPKFDYDNLELWRSLLPHVPCALNPELVHPQVRHVKDIGEDSVGQGSHSPSSTSHREASKVEHNSDTHTHEVPGARLNTHSGDPSELEVSKASAKKRVEDTHVSSDNMESLILQDKWGLVLFLDHRFDEAEAVFRQAVQRRLKIYGERYAGLWASKAHLALTLAQQNDKQKLRSAEELCSQLIVLQEEAHGKHSLPTLTAMALLSEIYMRQRRFVEAKKLASYVYMETGQLENFQHPLVAATVRLLGAVDIGNCHWGNAKIHFEKITLYEREQEIADPRQFVYDNASLALVMANLGINMQYVDAAIEYQLKAVEFSRRLLGNDHPMTLNCLKNLAHYRMARQEVKDAVALMKEFVDLSTAKLGADHLDVQTGKGYLEAWEQGHMTTYKTKSLGQDTITFESTLVYTPTIWHLIFQSTREEIGRT